MASSFLSRRYVAHSMLPAAHDVIPSRVEDSVRNLLLVLIRRSKPTHYRMLGAPSFRVLCERVGAAKVGTHLYRNETHRQVFLSSSNEQPNREAYSALVPTGLTRYYGSQDLHFITCSCHKRQPWLGTPERRTLFLNILEQTRATYEFVVAGYVVMPEHFHLLISEPEKGDPSLVMQVLKQRFSRQVLTQVRRDNSARVGEAQHVWEKRFHDFNVWTARKHAEKLHYMHLNPVRRGLVSKPEDWPWSSFRFYAYGQKGLVTVNAPGSARIKIGPPAA